MLDGVAMVITRAREASMAVHTRPESLVSNSEKHMKNADILTLYHLQTHFDASVAEIGTEIENCSLHFQIYRI